MSSNFHRPPKKSDQPPHITSVQYCVGCSVHWRLFSTSGDNISTVGGQLQYCGGIFNSVEVVQYSGGIASVLWGDSFSTVEVVQYSGGITSVHVGDTISTVGGKHQYCGGYSVLWRDTFSTVGDNSSNSNSSFSTVGDTFSTVEVVQYSGG